MAMRTIAFNGVKLEYKSTHRALYEYEKLSGKDEVNTYTDSLMLMFCIVKTQAKAAGIKFELDFEQFIDWLDANPDALQGFTAGDEIKEAGGKEKGSKKK